MVASELTGDPVPGFPDLWLIRWRGREYVALRGSTTDAEAIAERARDWDAAKLYDTVAITPEQRDACVRWSINKPTEPGTVPGWGMSWWVAEQGLDWLALSPDERVNQMARFWDEVATGWEPPVPREQWKPYHPFDPADEYFEPE